MAETLAKSHYPSWIIESAGSAPTGDVDPLAKIIVQEVGLDIDMPAQQVNLLPLETYDLIITLCADEDICPLLPHKVKDRVLHMPFEDPSLNSHDEPYEALIARYRRIRNQIDDFCKTLEHHLMKAQKATTKKSRHDLLSTKKNWSED